MIENCRGLLCKNLVTCDKDTQRLYTIETGHSGNVTELRIYANLEVAHSQRHRREGCGILSKRHCGINRPRLG